MTTRFEPKPARGFQESARWPLVRIGDVARLHYGKALIASSRRNGEIRVYGSNGQCGWHDTALAQGPTVLLGRKGQGPLGVEWCPWPFWVIDTAYYVTVDSQRIDLRYFYFLTKFIGLNHLKDGTSNPSLSRDVFSHQGVPLPPLPDQRQIAGVLSAYDELMENGQRRIHILEAMARALYREWFVHFRFPDHEKFPRVASSLGEIPEGWEVKKLGEVADITMGLSPKGNTYNEERNGTPLVNGPVEFGERFTNQIKWTTAPTKFCKEGDLVVCVRGSTTGKYVKSDGVYCLGRGVCGLSGKYQCFVSRLFENELPTLLGQTSGSTFPSWTGPQLKNHSVMSPPPGLLERFEALVKPMSAAVLVYSRKIENLRRTRDLLLPRLLSGQVELAQSNSKETEP